MANSKLGCSGSPHRPLALPPSPMAVESLATSSLLPNRKVQDPPALATTTQHEVIREAVAHPLKPLPPPPFATTAEGWGSSYLSVHVRVSWGLLVLPCPCPFSECVGKLEDGVDRWALKSNVISVVHGGDILQRVCRCGVFLSSSYLSLSETQPDKTLSGNL